MAGTSTSGFAHLPPAQRSLAAAVGSLTNWSRKTSPAAREAAMAPVQIGLARSWERKADPEGVLPPDELALAVARIKKAHYRLMALKSAQKRAQAAA